MIGQANSWPHQIEFAIPRIDFDARLRGIEAWLREWAIPYRVGSSLGTIGLVWVRFAEERFARAFRQHHGGRIIPAEEVVSALSADSADEDLYDRLAREYPD